MLPPTVGKSEYLFAQSEAARTWEICCPESNFAGHTLEKAVPEKSQRIGFPLSGLFHYTKFKIVTGFGMLSKENEMSASFYTVSVLGQVKL
jgi:hypothetical protein